MRTILITSVIFGVTFGSVIGFAKPAAQREERQERAGLNQKISGLEVLLIADKLRYKRSDDVRLDVRLVNTNGLKEIFVYGTLEFGLRASLMLSTRDAKGSDVPSRFFPDAWELPPERSDRSAFVKLLPDHYLGTTSWWSIQKLGMIKPGVYTMWVEYSCPISVADVEVSPFWSKESGAIKSNVVRIQVVR